MNTLVIYAGPTTSHPELDAMLPKGTKVSYLDMATYKHMGKLQKMDIIIAFHSLQTVEAKEVPATVAKMISDLNVKGELWIYVPALEWVAAQTAEPDPSPAVHTVLYGPPDFPHRCAFTLQWLRGLLEASGLVIRRASHEGLELKNQDAVIKTSMNVIVGWKFEEPETAKDAIK